MSGGRQDAIDRVTRHFDNGGFWDDLSRRVAIRSTAQVPELRGHLMKCAVRK